MRNDEWINLMRLIPPEQQDELVLVLQNGVELSVDQLVRFESNFVVVRGRVAGTSDEGRGFFVPYDQLTYFRIDRVVKAGELRRLCGERVSAAELAAEDGLAGQGITATPEAPAAPSEAADPQPEPANAARNKLLERIRAAKTGGSSQSS